MNNPDWRGSEEFIVRQQLESGHDGIFFDNPTVHPEGCYCPHCMAKFAQFLNREGVEILSTGSAGTLAGENFRRQRAGKGDSAPSFTDRHRRGRTTQAMTDIPRDPVFTTSP